MKPVCFILLLQLASAGRQPDKLGKYKMPSSLLEPDDHFKNETRTSTPSPNDWQEAQAVFEKEKKTEKEKEAQALLEKDKKKEKEAQAWLEKEKEKETETKTEKENEKGKGKEKSVVDTKSFQQAFEQHQAKCKDSDSNIVVGNKTLLGSIFMDGGRLGNDHLKHVTVHASPAVNVPDPRQKAIGIPQGAGEGPKEHDSNLVGKEALLKSCNIELHQGARNATLQSVASQESDGKIEATAMQKSDEEALLPQPTKMLSEVSKLDLGGFISTNTKDGDDCNGCSCGPDKVLCTSWNQPNKDCAEKAPDDAQELCEVDLIEGQLKVVGDCCGERRGDYPICKRTYKCDSGPSGTTDTAGYGCDYTEELTSFEGVKDFCCDFGNTNGRMKTVVKMVGKVWWITRHKENILCYKEYPK